MTEYKIYDTASVYLEEGWYKLTELESIVKALRQSNNTVSDAVMKQLTEKTHDYQNQTRNR